MADDEWVPAFPGQRPPFALGNDIGFTPGNELAVKHGGYSPRKVDPLAAELVAAVLTDGGLAAAPAYRMALWAWGRAEAQVQLLTEWLSVKGEAASDGVGDLADDSVRAAYLLLHRAEARATTQRGRLGLDPLSRARLGRDVAQGAAADAATQLTRMRADAERRAVEEGDRG